MAKAQQSPQRPPNDEAFEILRSIRRVLRKVSEHSRHLSRVAGLTVPQLLCLRAVGELGSDGEVTVASIGRQVHLSPPTVSRILDRLEEAGYVLRKPGSGDRRKLSVVLTASGQRKFRSLPAPLHDEFLSRLDRLEAGERSQLRQSLARIVDLMEATDIDAAPILTPIIDIKQPTAE